MQGFLSGLAYGGHSLASPAPHWSRDVSRSLGSWRAARIRAESSFQIAVQIYREEWLALNPLVRPAEPNLSLTRAYRDGFITGAEHTLLETTEEEAEAELVKCFKPPSRFSFS